MGTKENENQAGLGNSMRYYALLGISLDATTADVRKAFKKLALAHHPDKGGEEATFKAISCAYETLVDPIKRRKYDLNQAVRREGGSRGAPHPTASSPCIRSGGT
jgi:DnaJ-class molecular chaperone